MCDLTDFFEAHPRSMRISSFDNYNLSVLEEYKLPKDIIEFLKKDGISTYHNDFLSSTLPQEHFQVFSEWGLKGTECFAFLKTALGTLCFYRAGKIFRLDPITGHLYKGKFEFCEFMNLVTTFDSFLESCYFDIYQKIEKKKVLAYDEIYGLVPALPLGGSFETSHFEVVKINEHLGFLAQLFDNKAKNL